MAVNQSKWERTAVREKSESREIDKRAGTDTSSKREEQQKIGQVAISKGV